jgi:hypothetical protein
VNFIVCFTLLFSCSVFACKSSDLVITSVDQLAGNAFSLEIKAYIPNTNQTRQLVIPPPIGGASTYIFFNWSL